MVETRHLLLPVTGSRSDPLLFGVAEGLARLFPIEEAPPRPVSEPLPEDGQTNRDDEALAA